MAEVVFDVVEEILIRLDVKDLIRCKSVCKSWHSFMSTPRFVKAHLNHNIKRDRDNRQLGHRRIFTLDDTRAIYLSLGYKVLSIIVGSCNGLVCVSPRYDKFLVTNPSTRQQKKLQTLPYKLYKKDMISHVECWGFGYDSSSDDYKVIVGFKKDFNTKWTTFHVLTLKSNTWKVIGELKYKEIKMGHVTGILCDGALYWFMADSDKPYEKKAIISFDLSTDKLKEIPQPDADEYHKTSNFFKHMLGVIEDSLCVYICNSPESPNKWLMKNNKWELYTDDDCERSKYDITHRLTKVDDSQKTRGYVYSLQHDDGRRVFFSGNHIRSSIFVKSLVSPHPHVDEGSNKEDDKAADSGNTRKRKRSRSKRSRKHKKASG